MSVFRVGVARDLRGDDGTVVHDLCLDHLDDDPDVSWEFLPAHELELSPDTIAGFDALMIWEPGGVSAATLAGSERLALIARFGMGLEAIDLAACSDRGVIVTTAPDAVLNAVPSGAMALLLALAHGVVGKDRLVRENRWDERFAHVSPGTGGRVLGIIGLGNVGRGVARRAGHFGMRRLAFDPYIDPGAVPADVKLVELETLLRESDFVCVTCPLTDATHHLLDAPRIAMMRVGAMVVNVARGPIVDTRALAEALASGHLSGAGLDVFETEPIEADHPLLGLDNVILSPHAIAYSVAAFQGLGRTATGNVLAVAHGRRPEHVANPVALEHPRRRALS